jgi:glucosamine--fructose-6-phosphate aminotransferase (isomerizing)
MAKEINEQPEAIERLLQGRLGEQGIEMDELRMTAEELAAVDRIYLVACGTSYHVWSHRPRDDPGPGQTIPVVLRVRLGAQLRGAVLVTDHTLCVIVTQSGETADTLTAARRMKGLGCKVFAVTNVLGSTAARES